MKNLLLIITLSLVVCLQLQGQNTGDFRSMSAGPSNWNDFNSWEIFDGTSWIAATSGQLPSATSAVEIQSGHSIVVNAASLVSANLAVNGSLSYDPVTVSSLTVSGNVNVGATGSFTSPASGTVLTHALTISGNLVVDGTFNMNVFSTAAVAVTFTGATSNSISGAGSTINFYSITVNKGASNANVLEVLAVITIVPPTVAGTRLTITNGTFKLSSASSIAPYYGFNYILNAATAKLWLNNSGCTVQNVGAGTTTGAGRCMVPSGTLQITAGTFSYGSGSDIHSFGSSSPNLIIDGANATMNIYGALQLAYGTVFNMSAGNLNIYPQAGNNLTGYAALSMESYFLITTTDIVTGGTITIVDPPTGSNAAFVCSLTNGTYDLSGMTLRFGNGTSDKAGSANGFMCQSNLPIPNVIVNNNPASVLATRIVKLNGAFTVGNLLTINSGTANKFVLNGFALTLNGNLVNSGTFTGDGAAGNSVVFSGTVQQVVSGTGTFTNGNINGITVNNTSGANPSVDLQLPLSVSNALNLTSGSLGSTNASTFTIGRSASSTSFTMTRSWGSLTAPVAFALGGVATINYNYNAAPATTTGNELPAGVTLTSLTINNASGVTLDKPVTTTTLNLTAGVLATSSVNLITVSGTAVTNVTGGSATAYVNGPLARVLPNTAVNANYKFPVGKTGYRLFEFQTITTGGTGTATFTAEAFDAGPYPGSAGNGMSSINTDKYWALTASLGTVTITSSVIRITEAGLGATNKIGQANAVNGSFNNIGGALGTGTISSTMALDYSGIATGTFFRIGVLGSFAAGNYAIGPNGPYAGYAGTYPSFQSASSAVSEVTVSGNVIFEFQPDYLPSVEVFPVSLISSMGGSASATITFRPAATVTSLITFSAASTILNMPGCDYVTIDGRNGGTGTNQFFQFTSTGTTTPVVTMNTDATFNQFLYCGFKGNNTTAASGLFVVTTPMTAGNNNYTIDHCNFDGSVSAANCIYQNTTALNAVITNNNFFDYKIGGGIYIASSASNAVTVDHNNFYATTVYTGAAGTTYGIYMAAGNNCQISNNNIGGSGPGLTGIWTVSATTPATYNFTGIYASLGATGLSKIYNNTIQNFDWKSTPATFSGINLISGLVNIGTDGANVIGSSTGNDNIKVTYYTTNSAATVYGIQAAGAGPVRVENNSIGSITTALSGITGAGSSIIGIYSGGTTCTIRNNMIGSTVTPQSFNAANQSTIGSAQNVYGIYTQTSTAITVNKNTVANLYNGMTFTSASAGMCRGIKVYNYGTTVVIDSNLIYSISTPQQMTGSGIGGQNIIGLEYNWTNATSVTISGNTIYDLVNTAPAGAVNVVGIYFHGPTGGTSKIDKNLIHSLVTSSPAAVQNGFMIDYGLATFQNNGIRLGIDKTGASIATTAQINGILKTGGNLNCYFNTVYIGGTGVAAGTVSTYDFNMTAHSIEDIRDNIFINQRTNAVANPIHYAILYPTGLTTNFNNDYNIYNISSTDGKLAKIGGVDQVNIGALQTALPGFDLHSGFGNPLLISPSTDVVTLNLAPQNFSPAEGNGVDIVTVTDDFSGSLRSSLTPVDIGAYAGNFTPPGPGQDIWYPIITYTNLPNTGLTTNRTIVNFAAITDNFTGVNTTAGTKPRIYFKKSTDANAFVGNTSADNGWKWVEANNSASPFDFTIDYSIINGGSVVIGDIIQYYVVVQDQATTPNVSFSPSNGASGSSVATTGMTAPTTPNSYGIVPTMPSAINVGTGYIYTTLTGTLASGGLFAAINAGVINSNLVITVKTDIVEPATVGLNLVTEEGPNAGTLTVTIQGDGTPHLISGSAVNVPLIPILGAKRVTIDGGAGKLLTFRNTYTAIGSTGPVIQFNNGAQNCTLTNSIIESNAYNMAFGAINVGNTGVNSVVISNNDIRDARGGTIGTIKSGITSNSVNNTLSILNNNIYNWKSSFYYETGYGVYLTAVANGCVISGNSFYMEPAASPTCGENAIYLLGGNGHTVTGNFIGGSAPGCSGTWTSTTTSGYNTVGIFISGGTAPGSIIQGNTISNFSISGTPGFIGIQNVSGVSKYIGNTIGSATVPNSISLAGAGTSYGLYNQSQTGSCDFDQNVIANITLNAASGAPGFRAMQMLGGNVRRNMILSIGSSAAAAAPAIYGIYNTGGVANNEYSNNMITLNGGASTNPTIYGFYDTYASGINTFYYNSINLYGTPSGAASTYAYYRSGAGAYTLNDNILVNQRTGGTGKHYAIASVPTTGFTSNYNDLYVGGTVLGLWGATDKANLAAWQAIVITPSLDLNSLSVMPAFLSNTDLHITSDANIANKGIAVPVLIDIDGLQRSSLPDMGINQFGLMTRTLNLTVFLEGLYAGGGIMNAAIDFNGTTFLPKWGAGIADQITVELHNSGAYGTLVTSLTNIPLSTSGTATITIPAAFNGSYYLTVVHRNSIATVSASPLSFSSTSLSYNFSTAATQAYGSNMKNIGGVWCLFTGDVSSSGTPYPGAPVQDGVADIMDLYYIYPSYLAGGIGYLPSDVNGDGVVDITDTYMTYANYLLGVYMMTPP